MGSAQALIANIYAAFNERDIDGALARMSETVSWPKASEGGRVVGKGEIRAYWSRQWKEFDPHVMPIEVTERGVDGHGASKVDVRVQQVVKSLDGKLLSDTEVVHQYTIANGLIERMDIAEGAAGNGQTPSSAFSHAR